MIPGRPNAIVTLDGRALSAAEAALVRLRVEMSLGGAHDVAELVVWPRSKFASAAPGAKLAIALGTLDDEVDVWTGSVTEVAGTPDGVFIEGLDATLELSRTTRSQTYLGQTVADIVQDLAGPVAIDEVEADLTLDAYSVDDRRSVWGHLVELVRLAGCDLGVSASGGIRCVPSSGRRTEHRILHGATVLGWSLAAMPAPVAAGVAALGAASEDGTQKWHWLRRDPVPSPGETPTLVLPALRTRDAAEAYASALAAAAGRAAMRGELTIVGDATIRPGDAVNVEALPGAAPGPSRVRSIEHVLDGLRGFVTTLRIEAAATAGAMA